MFPFLEEAYWQQKRTVGCAMDPATYYAQASHASYTLLNNHGRPTKGGCRAMQAPCYRNKAWHTVCEAIPCTSEHGGGLARSSTLAYESKIVEQQIYSIDAAFLKYLLGEVVEPRRSMFLTDWGVDNMWCFAAHAYIQRRPGSEQGPACAVVPVAVAIHHNTRTISKWDAEFREAGRSMRRHYYLKYPQFQPYTPCNFTRLQVLGVVHKLPQKPERERKRALTAQMQMRAQAWKACTSEFMPDLHPPNSGGPCELRAPSPRGLLALVGLLPAASVPVCGASHSSA